MEKLVVIALMLSVPTFAHAQEPKKDEAKKSPIKCVLVQIEMTSGVKFKSLSQKDGDKSSEFKITLEFTKDIIDPAELKSLKGLFSEHKSEIPGDTAQCPLVFHLFDEENVSLNKYVIKTLEGDVTGVKGDAFRIVIECDSASAAKAKRLEARLRAEPKAK
jgi:hypothetical protein